MYQEIALRYGMTYQDISEMSPIQQSSLLSADSNAASLVQARQLQKALGM